MQLVITFESSARPSRQTKSAAAKSGRRSSRHSCQPRWRWSSGLSHQRAAGRPGLYSPCSSQPCYGWSWDASTWSPQRPARSFPPAASRSYSRRETGSFAQSMSREAMNRLDAKGYAPGMRLLELQRQRRGEAGDRDVAAAQEAKGFSDAQKLARQMGETREQARRIALTDLAKAQSEVTLRREEVTK